jgi:hypothetical protein
MRVQQRQPLGHRVRRPDEGFAATGAFEPVQPNHRDAGFGFHGGHDLGNHGSFQAHGRRGRGAEFEEVPSIDAVRAKDLVSRRQTFRLAHNHLLGRHELPAPMERSDSKIGARKSNRKTESLQLRQDAGVLKTTARQIEKPNGVAP